MILQYYWNTYGFEIVFIASICVLCIAYLFNYNGSGTYNQYDVQFKDESQNKGSAGEKACRSYLEMRFQRPFPNVRPKWMFNSETGRNLELDMYNSELKLACEYNGKQHYEYTSYWHGNYDNFVQQQRRDQMKQNICRKLGIRLITVPYTVKIKDIPNYIEGQLKHTF